MSNLLLQKIVLLRVTEVGKIILKKKRPLLLARSVEFHLWYENYRRHFQIYLQWKCLNFNYNMYNFTEVYSQGSNWL